MRRNTLRIEVLGKITDFFMKGDLLGWRNSYSGLFTFSRSFRLRDKAYLKSSTFEIILSLSLSLSLVQLAIARKCDICVNVLQPSTYVGAGVCVCVYGCVL